MVKIHSICLSLFCVLLTVDMASAGSKHGFAPLDERDLTSYLQKQAQENDPYLYLFSTLSLIRRRKDNAAFTISKSSSAYATPLVALEIYPELHMHLQSEFFDSTIWGQWGNYFNKSIEIVELENEILRLLNALNDLNEKYQDLIQTTNPVVSQPRRLPTLDRKNYVSVNDDSDQEKANKSPHDPRSTADKYSTNDLRGNIERYETQIQQEKLKSNPTFQKPPPEASRQRSYATTSLGVAGPPGNNTDAGRLQVDNVFIHILQGLASLANYLVDHKVETCIYFYSLLLFGAFIKVLLQR